MGASNSEELAGKLIHAIENISPGNLKEKSHTRLSSQILELTKQAIKQDGFSLMILIQSIKHCKTESYKRDVLIEVLDGIITNKEFAKEYLFRKPFQAESARTSTGRKLANAIVSIPDILANCKMLDQYKHLQHDSFHRYILAILFDLIKQGGVKDNKGLLYLLQVLVRIAMTNKLLVLHEFTNKLLLCENDDELSLTWFQKLYQLPIEIEDQDHDILTPFIDHICWPPFQYTKPSLVSIQRLSSLLGPNMIKNSQFNYIICDRSLLRANYSSRKTEQKITLLNIFHFLAEQKDDEYIIMRTLSRVLSDWSNCTKLLLRTYEHSRYLTWAAIIGFRLAKLSHMDQLKLKSQEYQSMIVRVVPAYLSRSDAKHRSLGIVISQMILPDLHRFMTGSDQPAEFNALQLIQLSDEHPEYQEALQLYIDDLETCLKGVNWNLEDDRPRIRTETIISTLSAPKESIEVFSPQNKKVIDSEDESESEDDDVLDKNLSKVPIYLRDCVDGLMDRNSNRRYVRLCLTRAAELVEKLVNEHGETNIILEVGVELAQAVLFIENQYKIKNFDEYRFRILSSICSADPTRMATYLLTVLNSSQRSMRHQLDILESVCRSAKQLSTRKSAPHIKYSMNQFATYVQIYFNGISYRLKSDYTNQAYSLITPEPRSILSAFKDQREGSERILRDILIPPPPRETGDGSDKNSGTKIANDRVLEVESISDDSYLLSRILISLTRIYECASHQPALCRISGDFIAILKAYRCHPDTGVQNAIINCLIAIRDFTPRGYFKDYLERPMIKHFHNWLEKKALAR